MNQLQGKFLLPWIYNFIQWVQMFVILIEELISVLSVPLLSFGVSISLIDFFMHGTLSKDAQFAYTWSIIQAVSIDAQIAFTWYKAKMAWQTRNYKAFLGFLFIGATIGFVVWSASSLQGLAIESDGANSQAENLAKFGLSPEILIGARQGVAVVLLCIAGWTRKLIDELANTSEKKIPVKAEKRSDFWTWLWALITFKKVRDFFKNWQQEREQKKTEKVASGSQKNGVKETDDPLQELKENDPDIAEDSPSKEAGEDVKNLDLAEAKKPKISARRSRTFARKSTQKNGVRIPKLSKNLYTKNEVAKIMNCDVFEIEKALQNGVLLTSGNGEKVLKSSLKRFIVKRKQGQEKEAV